MGRTKLGLTNEEIGSMTLTLFNRQLDRYKDFFDYELAVTRSGLGYREFYKKAQEEALRRA